MTAVYACKAAAAPSTAVRATGSADIVGISNAEGRRGINSLGCTFETVCDHVFIEHVRVRVHVCVCY